MAHIVLDIEEALRLHDELGSWKAVAERLNLEHDTAYNARVLTVAASHWRQKQGCARRSYEAHGLGAAWAPAPPRAWRIVPDYGRDTTRRA